MRPFKIFDYDLDGVEQYRIKRDHVGDYSKMQRFENILPTKEDIQNFNCITLIRASISDENIPLS